METVHSRQRSQSRKLDVLQYLSSVQELKTDVQPKRAFIEAKVIETVDRLSELTGMPIKSMSEAQIQAYTTVGGTPFLDDQYTVFGEIISGLDIIDGIAAVKTAPGDRPLEDVMMFMTVEELPKKEITEKYGYDYQK